jgi:hypothetical protein
MGAIQSGISVIATSPTPQAVIQAAEWRFLIRALYLGAGSPPVPGFTEVQVDQVLWGELPADAEFFTAMLRLLSGPRPTLERDVDPRQDDVDLDRTAENFRRLLEMQDNIAQHQGPGAAARSRLGRSTGAPVLMLPPEAARGFTPPNPETFGAAAEFIEGMDNLRTWAKLSLRDIEERSAKLAEEGEPVIWLPRSTLSDTLNRKDRLPRQREFVQSYVAACGLPPAARMRWLKAYDRLNVSRLA